MEKLYNFNFLLYLTLYLLGGMATFSLPPYSIVPLIFILGFGIYIVSNLKAFKKIFFAGFSLGFGWFSFGLYWIGSAFLVNDTYDIFFIPLGVIILPSILALFWAIAFLAAKFIGNKLGSSTLTIVVFLSLSEYLRCNIFSGFPWLMPSMVLSSNENLIQIFSFIGSYTSNLLVFIVCISPLILLKNTKDKYSTILPILIPIFILLFASFYRSNNRENLKILNQPLITIVQPNIKQKAKWDILKRTSHLKTLVKLSNQKSTEYINTNRIIIWPETSFEGVIPKDLDLISNITKDIINNINTSLIIGTLSLENKNLFNSLIYINSLGNLEYKYDKIHLVPFGEYIPFISFIKSIGFMKDKKDFSSGTVNKTFKIPNIGDVLPLICYEVLFSEEVRNRISKNTKLIINITNDAWFGDTSGPHQHLALAKIRAVEFGIPLVRVANTGISAFISPYGKEILRIPLNTKDVKTTTLLSALDMTMYRKYGDYIFIISILFILFINIISTLKKNKEGYPNEE